MKTLVNQCTVFRKCLLPEWWLVVGFGFGMERVGANEGYPTGKSFRGRFDGEPLPFGRGLGISRGVCFLTSDSPPR
jgi:hypothetical protein